MTSNADRGWLLTTCLLVATSVDTSAVVCLTYGCSPTLTGVLTGDAPADRTDIIAFMSFLSEMYGLAPRLSHDVQRRHRMASYDMSSRGQERGYIGSRLPDVRLQPKIEQ